MPNIHEMQEATLRPARSEDRDRLQHIRAAAFAPVFAMFRSMLGDVIYELAQAREDQAQERILDALLVADDDSELYVAELDGEVVGFVSIELNRETTVGVIGLNAVDPAHSSRGIGTRMYEFAVARMRGAGMRVATVATGDDPSHAPARRAYAKAGFSTSIPSVWLCREL